MLLAVTSHDAYANLLLPNHLREQEIVGPDASFATELAYGTLRWQGCLDTVIQACVDRPLDRVDPPVRNLLRLGVYQLLHTRVPAHAAVAETAALARAVLGERPVGFVNAVLRRAAGAPWPEWVRRLAPSDQADQIGHLAFVHGYPRWIAAAFADALAADAPGLTAGPGPGERDADELSGALTEERPLTHLAARPGRLDRGELLAQTGTAGRAGHWSPYAVHLLHGDPHQLPAVRERRATVQDEGSQLATLAIANAPLTGADRRWLDACAGPGGKAALLAGLAAPREATLLAADRRLHRARLVAGVLSGTPGTFTVCADSTRPPWREGRFDRVLVDAPCTGLGALRRRPDARWRRRPDDVPGLSALQRELLVAALDAVRPGGVVGYVTCSPHPAETRLVVADVLHARSDVHLVDVRPLLPGVPALGPGPWVQLWPHRHGTDAMFIAALRRAGGGRTRGGRTQGGRTQGGRTEGGGAGPPRLR